MLRIPTARGLSLLHFGRPRPHFIGNNTESAVSPVTPCAGSLEHESMDAVGGGVVARSVNREVEMDDGKTCWRRGRVNDVTVHPSIFMKRRGSSRDDGLDLTVPRPRRIRRSVPMEAVWDSRLS
jgi:hypothetical protein